jgi:arylsulfatase A-like enzyme
MDVVIIILDALSFESTPFADDGPPTMPQLESLTDEYGVLFTESYAPGTSSPSSHASILTGEYPSKTGMHEASPYFHGGIPTITERLPSSYRSLMISYNPFIFNGLDRGFDRTNDLRSKQYTVFESASDPYKYAVDDSYDSLGERYLEFLLSEGKPLRSMVNGLSFKLWNRWTELGRPRDSGVDGPGYQYANQMNEKIRKFLGADGDSFVVANYMDIHPPLDAGEEALERFTGGSSREDLPVGLRTKDILNEDENRERRIENMRDLYYATIWDTDRKVTGLIRELVQDDSLVIVTADHGNRFSARGQLDDTRIHVPLIVFHPDETARTVDSTVNLRSIPRTVTEATGGAENQFAGQNLLDVTEDGLSITEFIHAVGDGATAVTPLGGNTDVQYDVAGIIGDTKIEFRDGEFHQIRGGAHSEQIQSNIRQLVDEGLNVDGADIDYDDSTEERLEDLGYL